MKNKLQLFITIALILFYAGELLAQQPVVADKIVAIVGKNAILYSDVEDQYIQLYLRGQKPKKCDILENLLVEKLLLAQAEIDSIEVTDADVEYEMENRLKVFINQVGSEQKLVENLGKSIIEIKSDMRDEMRDYLLMQEMQRKIVSGLTITPTEVKQTYNTIPKDSLPYIDSEIEVREIVLYPKSNEDAILDVREKLLEYRQRVIDGESFSTLAILHSEDGSGVRGGDVGWLNKAETDPAYYKAAMALKPGQVSRIVESSFGFHLIMLIEKGDNRIHTRHILMKPKVSYEEKEEAINKLDSISRVIRLDSISFTQAAQMYSQDEDSWLNGGLKVNPQTLTTKFYLDDFDAEEYQILRKMDVGEISEPMESVDKNGKTVFKIIQLKSKTEPHVANYKQDFELLQNYALEQKRLNEIDKWVQEKIKTVYIKIDEPYKDCDFRIKDWK